MAQAPLPTVSVIIVNYNAGKLLTAAVKSVINFPGVEVVVVDNASRDTSMADLERRVKAKNLLLLHNKENLGFGKAVNQAVKHASGEYVYLLNPDAALTRTALSRMVETIRKYNNRAIVAPRLENPDSTPQSSCFRPQTIINAIKEYWFGVKGAYEKYLPSGKNPQSVHCAAAAAWLVPKSVWQELGGLDEKFFLYFEDLDMCDRASSLGIPVIYDPQAKVMHAHGVSSRTNPIVMKLFQDSALTYHGRFKKLVIDLIILSRNLLTPPASTKKILVLLATWTGLVFLIAAFGYFLLPARYQPLSFLPDFYRDNFLLWSWANFDGEHYLRIAKDGYQTVLSQSQYAFFPLFPLLIQLISLTDLDLYTSAHLLVAGSLIGFAFTLLAWAKAYIKNPLGLLALTLLSPGAVFLLAVYTEPLFLLLTALTFLFADRQNWAKAALFAGLATATRINGILLVIFLIIKMFRQHLAPKLIAVYSTLSATGLLAYMTYLHFVTGNPFSFYLAQNGWNKATPTLPWVTFSSYFRALTSEFVPDLTHLVVALEVGVTAIFLYLLVKSWRLGKLDSSYHWYSLGSLALPLATGSLGSMPRFVLPLFPLLLIFPKLNKTTRLSLLTFFVLAAFAGIILFTRGYWYA